MAEKIFYGGNIDACIAKLERLIVMMDQKRLLTNYDLKTTIPANRNLADAIQSYNATRDSSVDILKNEKETLEEIKKHLKQTDDDISKRIDTSKLG